MEVLTEIPEGFKTYLPRESLEVKLIFEKVFSVFEIWGYTSIIPPTIEYLKTFKVIDDTFEKIAFKLVDKNTGNLLAVRPDFTPQVARVIASSYRTEEPPFRIYYGGSIFRDHRGGDRESKQLGIELIGVEDVEADAEIVSVIANVLEELRISSFQINIGHVDFVVGAVEELNIPDAYRDDMLNLISSKDYSGIEMLSEKLHLNGLVRERLLQMLELYGDERVLSMGHELFSNKKSRRAIEVLERTLVVLKSYGYESKVMFDLSEKRGMKYHTGTTFEVFHPLVPTSISQGGRYDELLSMYGRPMPATGAAIKFDVLYRLLKKKEAVKPPKFIGDFYLIDVKKELRKAYEIGKELREKGYITARDIVRRDFRVSIEVGFAKGFKKVVVLNLPECNEDELAVYTRGGKRKIQKISEFLKEL